MNAKLVEEHALLPGIDCFYAFDNLRLVSDFTRGMNERFHIFGETRTTISRAGIYEVITDARIGADATPYGFNVST